MKEAITPAGQGLSGAAGQGGRTLRGQEESGVVTVFSTVGAASRIYVDVFKHGGHRTGPLSTYTAPSEKTIQQVGWEASGVGLSPFHPQRVSSGFRILFPFCLEWGPPCISSWSVWGRLCAYTCKHCAGAANCCETHECRTHTGIVR